jgi:MFS family permease
MNEEQDGNCTEDGSCSPSTLVPESTHRHNLLREMAFSLLNGVSLGMLLLAAPVVVLTSLGGNKLHITLIACAFPCGAFLGPLWAALGRRYGMQRLVLYTTIWTNLLMLMMFWVQSAAAFTGLIVAGQLLYSAARMGQSSTYRAAYVRHQLARVLGIFTFCTFATMIPATMLAGWLTDQTYVSEAYRYLYPLAGLCGLSASWFYGRLRLSSVAVVPPRPVSLRTGWQQARTVLRRDRAYFFCQAAFFLSGSAFFMSNHITLYLAHDWLHFEARQLALWMQVVPMVSLAVSSPFWGRLMDRIGIVRARLLISAMMTFYLGCYFGGLTGGGTWLICLGSICRGLAEGGGQVTWAMASVHFAPRHDDVPVYNGIHFTLNGIRGLVMPWFGSLMFLVGALFPVATATVISAASILVIVKSLRYGNGPAEQMVAGDIAADTDVAQVRAAG